MGMPALDYIRRQVEDGVIPSAAVAIGCKGCLYAMEAVGSACAAPTPERTTEATLYDLASLTKPMATAMVALKLAEMGALSLEDSLGDLLAVPEDKKWVTVSQLLTHAGGFSAHVMLQDHAATPVEGLDLLLRLPLTRPAGEGVLYSCLGYIVLGKALEQAGGMPLDELACKLVFQPLGMGSACFNPTAGCAATEFDAASGKYLRGVVHDENARFLGGVAGNAGLFAAIGDVARFASMLSLGGEGFLPGPVFRHMAANHTSGMAESRGLGFSLYDGRPLSCGDFFSTGSLGHTGYTGTSLWVDAATGLYVVLLTNAVHFGRDREQFFRARRIFHDLAQNEFGGKGEP